MTFTPDELRMIKHALRIATDVFERDALDSTQAAKCRALADRIEQDDPILNACADMYLRDEDWDGRF